MDRDWLALLTVNLSLLSRCVVQKVDDDLCNRFKAAFSRSTLNSRSMSMMLSRDFGPHSAVTEVRHDGAPNVLICVVLGLQLV